MPSQGGFSRPHLTNFVPYAVFGAAFLVLLGLRHVGLQLLQKQTRNRAPIWVALLDATRGPSVLWCIAAALDAALRFSDFPEAYIGIAEKIIVAALIVSFTLVASGVAVRAITLYGRDQGMDFAGAGLARTLTRAFILTIGTAILLWHFGMWKTVTPVLTALGVSGLAVALALQDTMANFFAGVHILVERPILLGDFVRLSTGEEGVVSDIGWRTTRIRTGNNNTIVIPNTKITSGILTNYNLPNQRVVAEVPIIAHLDADPDQIASIALDVAGETEGVMREPAPTVLFDPGITPTHMHMKLLVSVASQAQSGGVASAIRAGMLRRFRAEGVPLPSPDRVMVTQA